MSNSVGRIELDLGVNSSNFKREMNGIKNTAKSQTSGLTKMFKGVAVAAAAAFSVKAIVNFSKQCISLGSDLAEVQNVVDSTFGSMSQSVNQWAKDAMTSYGLSEKVAKEYVGQLGAMSKAFGNSNEEAYKQATTLAALTGDVASFYNLSTDEAFTKLKAVYTGETEALKSLGVVMTQAALDEYALAEGFGKTSKQMSEQEKVALRLSFVQSRLATASGDFARTSDGWANQTRVLALRFDALKASIGQGLIAALRPVVIWLNKIMVYLQAAADAFSNFMVSVFGSAETSKSASASLGDALATGSEDMASNMDSAAGTAQKIKKSLAGFDQINILSSGSDDAADAGGGSVSAGGTSMPTDAIESGLNNGAGAAGKIKGFLEEIKTKLVEIANITGLSGLWSDFLLSVENVKSGVLTFFDIFKASVANVAPNFEALKSSFSNTFTTIFQTVTGIMGDMWVSLSGGFKSFMEENRGEIETLLTNYMTVFADFWTLISNTVGKIFASTLSWWEADGKRLFDEVVGGIGNIGSGVLTLFNTISESVLNVMPNLEGLASGFANTFTTISQTVAAIVGDMFVSLSGGFRSFIEENRVGLETALTNTLAFIIDTGALISTAVGDVFASIRGWWESDGSRIFDEIIGVIKDVGNWIFKIWNSWISPVFDTISQALSSLWANNLKPLWDEILAFITSVWDCLKAFYDAFLKPVIDWIVDKIGPVFTAAINGLVKIISNAVATIVNVVKNVITAFRGILDFLTGVFKGDWEKAWSGLKTYFSGVVGTWKSAMTGVKDHFKISFDNMKNSAKASWEAIKSAWSSVSSWFKNIGTNIKSAFSSAWSSLKSGAKSAWSSIKSTFSNIPDWFKTKFTEAWTKVKNVFSTGGKIFDGIKDGIVSSFKTVVNGIISGINKVVSTPFNSINDVLDKIRKFEILGAKPFSGIDKISVPKIPQLASGGYVKANTPQLAIIGDNKREGEIVAPESKITEAVVAAFRQFMPMFGGGNKQPIYLTVKLGEGTFWEGFVDYHNDIVRRTGDTPLLV